MAKSYNFNLSSLPAEGVDLKLERQFTFSSSASDFLKKSGFDFSKVFTDGVPYLSRHEQYERQEEYSARADKKSKIPDIPINPDDVQTVEFMRYARKTVKEWVKESKLRVCAISDLRSVHLTDFELAGGRLLQHWISRKGRHST